VDAATQQLIEALHRTPLKCVIAVTGGGTGAVALLLSVPGGSRTVLEVQVPYHERALTEFLGRRPATFCSAATAQELAVRTYERAQWLAPGEGVIGAACTASLATDRPKRGDHRFHLAVRTSDRISIYSLTLSKGARDRQGEEALLDVVLLNALAEAFAIDQRLPLPLLPDEEIRVETSPRSEPLAAFLRGEVPTLCSLWDGRLVTTDPPPRLLLPGAFNPVHEGHWGMAEAASRLTGLPAAFELSVTNVDKPPLSAAEIRRRIDQFTWRAPLWLTRAPTFTEKSAIFPGVTFVVGTDTAARIVSPRYYGDDQTHMARALDHIRSQGCRFLVAGRIDSSQQFVDVASVDLPAAHLDLFSAIPETEFRRDISSTEVRARGAGRS
jgi:hypothetical protein